MGTNGVILKSTDAGVNWTQQSSGTNDDFYSTFFTGPFHGWAVGNSGTIRRTTDGGNSWNPVISPAGFTGLRAVWFLDQNIGFIGGGISNSYALILKTIDGGAPWTDISPNTGQVIYGFYFTLF